MPSASYQIVRQAIEAEQQIACTYQGHYRELCPHIVGRTGSEERLLAWQFGGTSGSGLPVGGAWKCLNVGEMRDVAAREGRWHTGPGHSTTQTCVQEIDLDINVHVRTGAR